MSSTSLNEEALEAMSRVMNPNVWHTIDRFPDDELVIMTKQEELSKAEKLATAYLAVAQPEVASDAGLHVGSLIKDRTGRRLWRVWCTGAPGIVWRDDEGMPATPVFPARVLYRPEVGE